MNSMNKIIEADSLMSAGQSQDALELLNNLIRDNPTSRSIYSDAINILTAGDLYEVAKEYYEIYQKSTGKDLGGLGGPDISLAEIQEKLLTKAADSKGDLNFKVLIINFGFNGIREINVSNDGLSIKKWRRVYELLWTDIIHAKVVTKYKDNGTFSYYLNCITLETREHTFKFKTSPNNPTHFKNESALLPALKKHLQFETVKIPRPGFVKRFVQTIIIPSIIVIIFILIIQFTLG